MFFITSHTSTFLLSSEFHILSRERFKETGFLQTEIFPLKWGSDAFVCISCSCLHSWRSCEENWWHWGVWCVSCSSVSSVLSLFHFHVLSNWDLEFPWLTTSYRVSSPFFFHFSFISNTHLPHHTLYNKIVCFSTGHPYDAKYCTN